MKTTFQIVFLSLLVIIDLRAQEFVFPVDANQDGIVNHYDVLPIGFAFGSLGPIRVATTGEELQPIAAHWSASFPNGVNFIHADANANGIVEFFDFVVMSQNQGAALPEVTAPTFTSGIWNESPSIYFGDGIKINAADATGTTLSIPLIMEEAPEEAWLNGLAFTIDLDPSYVMGASFEFANAWLSADGNAFQFLRNENNQIRVAVTRFGADPVTGGGEIGTLNLVIIEDLVGLLPNTPNSTPFAGVTGVQAVDGDFNERPIATQQLSFAPMALAVNTDNQLLGADLSISPNPITNDSPFSNQSSAALQLG